MASTSPRFCWDATRARTAQGTLARGRHGSVLGSAASTGIGPLDLPTIDALSRRRGRLRRTRLFELITMMMMVVMMASLGLFALLNGSSADSVIRLFLIFFAIYSDLLIVLLWLAEKDDAQTGPAESRPRHERIVPCIKGQADSHPQPVQPVDVREAHGQRHGRRPALRLDQGRILDHRRLPS
jgi:hypothetical protein